MDFNLSVPAAGPISRPIFVLGAPRSGTTWLAKILDSHPDVLYRHEPDEVAPPILGGDPERQLRTWVATRSVRAAGKRPFFPKSFLSPTRAMLRVGLAGALRGAGRLPGPIRNLARLPLPDLVQVDRLPDIRLVLKLVNWDSSSLARRLPDSRHLFILRHPCGQVASTIKGLQQYHFGDVGCDGLTPEEARTVAAFAAAHGETGEFTRLPLAARRTWSWRAFNETSLERLQQFRNVHVVRYETLCERPIHVAKSLFAFAGLPWHPQTEAFLDHSTQHEGKAGYFDVLRSSAHVPHQWRQTLPPGDQDVVQRVMANSPLARHWPELAAAA